MNEQEKMQRLLRMLLYLAGGRFHSRNNIIEQFGISESTFYRYKNTFEAAGFIVEQNDGSYRLGSNGATKTLDNLLHFSEEEVYLLYQTMCTLQGTTPLRERLVKKLYALYDLHALGQYYEKSREEVVSLLGEAVRQKRQVVLKDYRSNNSETIADRLVEAFAFLEDYSAIWCFDTESRSCKQFKLARIEQVHLQATFWQYTHLHATPFMDAFRMSAPAPIATVVTTLSLQAYNLLIEEYPLAQKYITATNSHYQLNIPVANYKGIARFAMGLPGEVGIKGPKELILYILQENKKLTLTG